MLFGWPAGSVVAALEGLVISLWLQRRRQPGYRVVFNAAAPALSICIASWVYAGLGAPLASSPDFEVSRVLLPLAALATTYFIANTSLIAGAIALEQALSAWHVWKTNFMWLWLNFFSGASVAVLLVSFSDSTNTLSAIWLVLPFLAVSFFTYQTSMARIADANQHVEKLNTLYMSTIETLAMAIDAKDQITHGHIRRVQTYAVTLAKEIGVTDPAQIKAIEAAALLHDMGKLAVPEYILNKPGPLTPAEFERMKQHASVGADILSAIDFPYPVVPIVRHHHVYWDGGGYPAGLRGAYIPIGARVLAVVDCFDALTSDRPYRPRLSDTDALKVLRDRRGTMYDPLVVDTFLDLYRKLDAQGSQVSGGNGAAANASMPRLAAITASAGESRAMYRLVQRLAAQESYSTALADVVHEISTLVPAMVVAFYVPTGDGLTLEASYVSGSHPDLVRGRRVRVGEGVVGWSASSGRSVLNADARSELGELARNTATPIGSCLTVPVTISGDRIGVLAAFSSGSVNFSAENQRLLEAVFRHIAPILERLKPQSAATSASPSASSPELTPVGMIACRCAASTAAGTEPVGIALAVIRRHLAADALTQIVHGNDIFIGIGTSGIDAIEQSAERLRIMLSGSGLVDHPGEVVVATTPRDGTNLEHLLYACRLRLGQRSQPGRVH